MTDYSPLQPTRDTDQHEQQKLAKKIKNFIYDPSEVIGSGFSSKVFKGINQQNNQHVAIKVIQLSKIQNQVQKYLLNNEINALRALDHKNILKTIDILMTKNNVYIVTEFCQFGDLQQMIKNNRKLQEKDALKIVKDIVQGYLIIQQKNIIHRDLKTANIFLSKTGAKIADFGFCQFAGQRKPQIAYNVGSPAYMSPQSYKQNFYSHKSDIWGIGIILYEMITGETPQKNLTYSQMSNNLMNCKINCGPNEQIRQILIGCFKKDLKERIDAKNLLQKITSLLQKISSSRQQGIQSNPPHPDGRFLNNNSEVKIPQSVYSNGAISAEQLNVKLPVDDNKFRSSSPSKLNPLLPRSQFQEITKQYSKFPNLNHEQITRLLTNKRQILHSSGLIQPLNTSKALETIDHSKQIRASISVLQFIFRLFKYLSQVSIPSLSFLKLLTFRHRSHIDQTTQNIFQQHDFRKDSQLYKQFQFLKIKFDEAYLERENNLAVESNHQLMETMNRLSNLSFIDSQSIKAYKGIVRQGCLEIQTEIGQNRSNAFVLWDYMMLEYQLLSLYGQGFGDQVIVGDKVKLQAVLKEQPRNLTKAHVQLLKIKNRYLFQGLGGQENDHFAPGNSSLNSKFILKGPNQMLNKL